jgi:cyclase
MNIRHASASFLLSLLLAVSIPAQDFEKVQIGVIPVAGNISMLTGMGGNMAICAGEDGVFLVDDQFAPLTEKITAAIATVSEKPVRFLLNTHWHMDHTGGNENLGKSGVVIVAHQNVRKRMSTGQFAELLQTTIPASPAEALPIITFTSDVTFHLNGEEIHVVYVDPAHTDGDAVVHFKKANVIHTGDLYFAGTYPFIDLESGGSLEGYLRAVDAIIDMANASTKIIPGHGKLSNVAEMKEWRGRIGMMKDRVASMIREGKTLDEIQKAKIGAAYDDAMGKGFIKPPQMIELLYRGLSRK